MSKDALQKAGRSPATKRRNRKQVVDLGKKVSIKDVEEAVRLFETGVDKEVSTDLEFKRRVRSMQSRSVSAIDVTAQMQQQLETMGTRLKEIREKPRVDPELDKNLTQAFILQSKLTMKSTNTLDDAERTTLAENLEEAQLILQSLDSVGDKRAGILLHALNGLANAKVTQAQGLPQRPEVISQLFTLINENQSLEVPHANAQVRLNHCLKITERIIGQQVDPDDVLELEQLVTKLEGMTTHTNAANSNVNTTPPVEED